MRGLLAVVVKAAGQAGLLRLRLGLCFGLLLGWASVAAAASSAPSFYSASVPVESQSVRDRDRAAAQGLREVLVRLSGRLDVESSPEIPGILRRASTLMEQFHYQRVRGADDRVQEHLVTSFAPAEIERILARTGLPFWPINRPGTLVWLVEQDPVEGRHLGLEVNHPLLQGLTTAAQARGLPLRWPLLDLEDHLALNAEQLWQLDERAILEASLRYKADAVLVGRLTQTSTGEWWTTWQFFHRGENALYDLRGEDALALGEQALRPLVDHLARLYALVPNADAAPQLVVKVSGVQDFAAYRGVLDYWKGLASVTGYQLLNTQGDQLLFSLRLNGNTEQLRHAMALDRRLIPEAAAESWQAQPEGSADNPLRFQWAEGNR